MTPDCRLPTADCRAEGDAIREALAAEIVRLRAEAEASAAAHARRVADLLEANGRILARARDAEAEVARLRILAADDIDHRYGLLLALRRATELTWGNARGAPPPSPFPPLADRPEGEWR